MMERYTKYKNSGISWLGEIPEHWEVKKIKWVHQTTSGGTPKTSSTDYYDGDIPWIRTLDLNNGTVNECEIYITKLGLLESSAKLVPSNSVLLAMYGGAGTIGKSGLLNFKSSINQAICAILPSDKTDSKFLHYFVIFYRPFWMIGAEGTRRDPNISQDDIKNKDFLFPPLEEQKEIAAYLDHKTAEIDQLIAQKERLIKLYEEEKTAIINEAVTKGINPNVKLKPSGIDWLGDIPEHWEVKRIKYVFDFHDSQRIPLSADQRGKMLVKKYDYYGASGIIDQVENYIFDGVYILFGEDGANLLTRNSPLAFKASGQFWVNNHAHILSPKNGEIDYLVHLLECANYETIVSGSAQPKITAEALGAFLTAIPPLEEQKEIVNYIEKETARIDAQIVKTKRIIELQKEYRTALISEAVTGKIKVPQLD